jgi:hypothetical protein
LTPGLPKLEKKKKGFRNLCQLERDQEEKMLFIDVFYQKIPKGEHRKIPEIFSIASAAKLFPKLFR